MLKFLELHGEIGIEANYYTGDNWTIIEDHKVKYLEPSWML